jgi:hypothetical protein
MGLADRPLHVVIGSPAVTDCVSPYTRELRSALLTWAERQGDALPGDLREVQHAPSEDVLYALAHEFLASDARLLDERLHADRTVGIQRHDLDGQPFELVDLGRIDPNVCDARLARLAPASDGAVLLRLPLDLEDGSGSGVRELLGAATNLRGITLVLDGTALLAAPGAVLLPSLLLRWAGESMIALPPGGGFELDELTGLAPDVNSGGAVLSVPHASLLSTDHVADLAQRRDVRAVEVGGAATLEAIAERAWRGGLAEGVQVAWAVVSSQFVASGRPSVATLSGQTAVAMTLLRRILRSPPPKAAAKKDRPRPSSGRSLRIKA